MAQPRRGPRGRGRVDAPCLRGPGQGDGQAGERHGQDRRGKDGRLLRGQRPARTEVREGRFEDHPAVARRGRRQDRREGRRRSVRPVPSRAGHRRDVGVAA